MIQKLILCTVIIFHLLSRTSNPCHQTAHAQEELSCDQISTIPLAECRALAALYETTDGSNWTDNSGWLSDPDPCTWYGITCREGAITALQLAENELSGPIPPKLGNLINLTRLSLYGNDLNGPIPPELSDLDNLTWLSLRDNQLDGPIPPELGNLTNLTWLSLGDNQLNGSIPPEIGNLSQITWLSLRDNQLSGIIPSELGNLTNLTRLYLGYNPFMGLLPLTLTSLELSEFSYSASNLCLPEETEFQSWLDGIENLSAIEVTCLMETDASGQNSDYVIYLPLIR